MFRMNWLHPPFDDQKVRQAALAALNQEDFLSARDRRSRATTRPARRCSSATRRSRPTPAPTSLMTSDFERSKQLLEEAGYDGTPVTLMHSTDLQVLANLAPVAKQLLEQGGFTVDMQSMDWQTLVSRRAKKEPPAEGGWNAFLTSWVAADVLNPISTAGLNASCEDAWFGWPCDEQLEQLRDRVRDRDRSGQADRARAPDPGARARGRHPRLCRPVVPADRAPRQRVGPAARPGAVLLERRQERVTSQGRGARRRDSCRGGPRRQRDQAPPQVQLAASLRSPEPL